MEQGITKPPVLFDWAPSIFPPYGSKMAVSLPCTQEDFERKMLDSPYVSNIYQMCKEQMAKINSETTEDELKKIKEWVDAKKTKLPVLIPGGHSLTGNRKATSPDDYRVSPFVTLDIDHVSNPTELWQQKIEPRVKELRIVLAFITPSWRGCKVMAVRPANMNNEKAMRWLASEMEIGEYDKCVKDPLRAHFTPCRDSVLYYDPQSMFDPSLSNADYQVGASETQSLTETQSLAESKSEVIEATAETVTTEAGSDPGEVDRLIREGYYGIPYEEIVQTYIEVIWNGKQPIQGDRNVKTHELASQLRHICDNNVAMLDRIIPSFAGLPEAEKRSAIRSATKSELRLMPIKLRDVLAKVKGRHITEPEVVDALDRVEDQQQTLYANQLVECFARHDKKLPLGIRDSFDGISPTFWMPALIGIAPFIGGLATGVRLKVHDDFTHINLFSIIVGEAASGKGKMDQLYQAWLDNMIKRDDVALAKEDEWRALPQKKRESTPKPVTQIRIQPLRCSVADVLSHLQAAKGKHLISFGSEADQLTNSQKSGPYANVSVLIRTAYDGAQFKSSYAGSSAVNANIKETLWNISMCTTPDGLYRAIGNVTDGELTRFAIGTTPDNTYSPLVRYPNRKPESVANIKYVADMLELLTGDVELPELEQACADWLEKERLDCIKSSDRARARQRFRVAVTSMRITCCLMLCGYIGWLRKQFARKTASQPKWMHGTTSVEDFLRQHPEALAKQLPSFQRAEYLESFAIIADYLLDNILLFFRQRIEDAYQQSNYAVQPATTRRGKNATLFDSLSSLFTIADIKQAKGGNVSDAALYKIAQRWVDNNLCRRVGPGIFEKATSV